MFGYLSVNEESAGVSVHMNHAYLSERTLEWIIEAVHPQASVLTVQPLQGGISSLVYGVTLEAAGRRTDVVLRQFNNADWIRNEPDVPLREAASLRRASSIAGVEAPTVIACDESGSRCGMPSLLMSRIAGEVMLQPRDLDGWLDGMARAIARVHETGGGEFPWTFAPYCDAALLDTSAWSRAPGQWREAADVVTSARPEAATTFIHRDFHPANVLWHDGRVSGIVDWVNGCIGPAGVDVGHCRVNLAQLHGVAAADEFLARYLRCAGESFVYDPYWDLVTLIDFAYWPPEVYGGWTALGVTGLTNGMMAERLDDYMISLLERVRR